MITCAHPSQLPGDKYAYNYHGQAFGNLPHTDKLHKLKFYRIDTTKTPLSREVFLEIPNERISYVHSFAHTKNYIVFMEFPLFW